MNNLFFVNYERELDKHYEEYVKIEVTDYDEYKKYEFKDLMEQEEWVVKIYNNLTAKFIGEKNYKQEAYDFYYKVLQLTFNEILLNTHNFNYNIDVFKNI